METFLTAFEAVLPLFLVILTGTLFARTKIANQGWVEILNKYALMIGFPALIIVSMLQIEDDIKSYLPLILINSAYLVVCLLLAYPVSAIFGFSGRMKRSLFLILPFRNNTYLGIPILVSVFGLKILPVAAILASLYVFWMFTLGLFLIEIEGSHKPSFKRVGLTLARNPLLISVLTGILLISLKISPPLFLDKTLHFFADSVTAVVLFSLGIFLGLQKAGRLKEWLQVAVFVTVTMFLIPGIFYFLVRFSGLPSEQLKSSVIDSALPLGLTPYALSVQYQLESLLFARIVVLGTLLSLIMIPVWITFMG